MKNKVEPEFDAAEIEKRTQSVVKSLSLELNAAGPITLWCKSHPLQIVVVNLDPDATLLLEQQWFECGDFWQQPFWNIEPYQFQTFSVCENNYFTYSYTNVLCCTCCESVSKVGVIGGVGFLVETAGKTSSSKQMFVCTFANPGIGSIKGRCEVVDVGSSPKGNEVKAVCQKMKTGVWIRSPRCGFYRGNLPTATGTAAEFGNKKMVFVWKPESVKFDEILAARVTQKHDFAKQTAGDENVS